MPGLGKNLDHLKITAMNRNFIRITAISGINEAYKQEEANRAIKRWLKREITHLSPIISPDNSGNLRRF